MAVNIAIGKQAPQVATPVEETTTEQNFDARVDELADLLAWEAKIKKDPKAVRLAELKKEFAKQVEDFDDEPLKDDIVFYGKKNRYSFGKRSLTRTVTTEGKELFANKVGEAAFLQCATIALKDIDQYIAKSEQGDYIETGFGSRTGKIEALVVKK